MTGQLALIARILATLGGGYAATVGGVTLLAALLSLSGMARSEAVLLMSMLGFVGFSGVILWGFAERRVWRVWAWLVGAAAAAHGLAWWLIEAGAGA